MPDRPVAVLKLGSSALLDERGALDLAFLDRAAAALAAVAEAGWRPVLVTSGAVASGRGLLRGRVVRRSLPERQALAAIGQADLMHRWQVALQGHGALGAQVLLTADDFGDRVRYLNLTATFRALFTLGAIPVVNENDTVAVDELTVGDNDRLSAQLAIQLGARRLVLATDIAGVYDRDPRRHADARLIAELAGVDDELIAAAGTAGTHGTGGMRSKLQAARMASEAGVVVHIVHARDTDLADCLRHGRSGGTRVAPVAAHRPSPIRRWLSLGRDIAGRVTVDAGAGRAVVEQGRSLLPAGILAVSGDFARGDTVDVVDESDRLLARGLAGLAADELARIGGQRMDVASRTLGYALPKAAIHRDNLLILSDEFRR